MFFIQKQLQSLVCLSAEKNIINGVDFLDLDEKFRNIINKNLKKTFI